MTAWEEAFLASLAARVWNAWGLINLTERQCTVLLQITDKIAAPMPDLVRAARPLEYKTITE